MLAANGVPSRRTIACANSSVSNGENLILSATVAPPNAAGRMSNVSGEMPTIGVDAPNSNQLLTSFPMNWRHLAILSSVDSTKSGLRVRRVRDAVRVVLTCRSGRSG